MGIAAGSREVPGRPVTRDGDDYDDDDDDNNNNNNMINRNSYGDLKVY